MKILKSLLISLVTASAFSAYAGVGLGNNPTAGKESFGPGANLPNFQGTGLGNNPGMDRFRNQINAPGASGLDFNAENFKKYAIEHQISTDVNKPRIGHVAPVTGMTLDFNEFQKQQALGAGSDKKPLITLKNYDTPAVKFIEKDRSDIVFDVSQPGVEGAARIKQRPEEFNGAGAAQVYEALKESFKTKEWAPVNQVQDLKQLPGIGSQLQQYQLRQVR